MSQKASPKMRAVLVWMVTATRTKPAVEILEIVDVARQTVDPAVEVVDESGPAFDLVSARTPRTCP